jgi:hypothetical protein
MAPKIDINAFGFSIGFLQHLPGIVAVLSMLPAFDYFCIIAG